MAYRRKNKLTWILTLVGVLFVGAKFNKEISEQGKKLPIIGGLFGSSETTEKTD